MPTVRLTEDAIALLNRYNFPGNIRQLRNIAEQLSVIETDRNITATTLQEYLPHYNSQLPSIITGQSAEFDYKAEREMMYNIILEMRKELDELKKVTMGLISRNKNINNQLTEYTSDPFEKESKDYIDIEHEKDYQEEVYEDIIDDEPENLSLQEQEIQMIKKSLEKHRGKRKLAAKELGISERTLYRKIKQYNLH